MNPWGSKAIRQQWEQLRRRKPKLARALQLVPFALVVFLGASVAIAVTDDPGVTLGTPQAAVLAKLGHPDAAPADVQEFVDLGRKRDHRFRRLVGECAPFSAAAGRARLSAQALADVKGSVLWYDRFPARSLIYVFDDEQRLSCVIKGGPF